MSQGSSSSGRKLLRYLVRVPLLAAHLAISLPLTLLVISSVGPWLRLDGERIDHRAIRLWSQGLVWLFGMRVITFGEPLPGPALMVANHITWLDIQLIHSRRMVHFVAKSEIAGWPVLGWLTKRAGTIFHRRGDPDSLRSVQQVMLERLRDGYAVAVFPEGSTGPGDHVRTFHARIFAVCEDAAVPAQPVGLRFVRDGVLTTAPAFRSNERFVANFFRLLGDPPTVAELHFLAPIASGDGGRRRMAEIARLRIASALGIPARDGRAINRGAVSADDSTPNNAPQA